MDALPIIVIAIVVGSIGYGFIKGTKNTKTTTRKIADKDPDSIAKNK